MKEEQVTCFINANPGGNERKIKLNLKNRRPSVVFDEFFLLQFFPFFRLENGFRAFSFSLDRTKRQQPSYFSSCDSLHTHLYMCIRVWAFICRRSVICKEKVSQLYFYLLLFFDGENGVSTVEIRMT